MKLSFIYFIPFFNLRKFSFFSVVLNFCFFFSCSVPNSNKDNVQIKKIVLIPYDDFSLENTLIAKEVLTQFFPFEITINENIPLDKRAFVTIKFPRYRADSIIRFQKKMVSTNEYAIGLTNKSISITKKINGQLTDPKYLDWGIMGLGYQPGNTCIISTYPLKGNSIPELFEDRFKKVIIHEFGHNLNLPHCLSEKCVMRDVAETIKTIDKVKLDFCSNCRSKLPQKPDSERGQYAILGDSWNRSYRA